MNRIETGFGFKREARLKFLDGEYQVVIAGEFVRCAISGKPIALDELRYWSVELQEAYASAEISMKRFLETR